MKFICIGKNYSEHIKEMGAEKPSEPVIFIKPDSSLIQKNNPFIIPSFSNKIHYEIEVLVLINKFLLTIELIRVKLNPDLINSLCQLPLSRKTFINDNSLLVKSSLLKSKSL